MRPQIAALIMSLNIGLFMPVFYVQVAKSYVGLVIFGLVIGAGCYFLVSFAMSRLGTALSPRSFAAKQLFSLGYYVAPLLAYLLLVLFLKPSGRH